MKSADSQKAKRSDEQSEDGSEHKAFVESTKEAKPDRPKCKAERNEKKSTREANGDERSRKDIYDRKAEGKKARSNLLHLHGVSPSAQTDQSIH